MEEMFVIFTAIFRKLFNLEKKAVKKKVFTYKSVHLFPLHHNLFN